MLFHSLIKQRLVTINHVINDIAVADGLEMLSSTMNLGFFNQPQLHRVHRALCLCYEINVFNIAFIECNSSVRIVVANWCGDIETIRQFYIHSNVIVDIQTFGKRFFVC